MDQDRLNQISNYVLNAFGQHIELMKSFQKLIPIITATASVMADCLNKNKKIMVCGNGGSAADAQHFAAEFTGIMMTERRALPCIALTTDSSALTAIGNDFGFDNIFSRQVEALANDGDVFFGISTSGNSRNVVSAALAAKEVGCFVVGLTGSNLESDLVLTSDGSICVPSKHTPRVQEAHIFVLHCLIDAIDRFLLKVK